MEALRNPPGARENVPAVLGAGDLRHCPPREDDGKESWNVPPDTCAASQERACSFGHADESWPPAHAPSSGKPVRAPIPAGADSPLTAPSLRLLLAHPTSTRDEIGHIEELAACGPPWRLLQFLQSFLAVLCLYLAPDSASPPLRSFPCCFLQSLRSHGAPGHPLRVFPSEALGNLPPALPSASHQHCFCQRGRLILKALRMLNLLSHGGGRTLPWTVTQNGSVGGPKGTSHQGEQNSQRWSPCLLHLPLPTCHPKLVYSSLPTLHWRI